MKNVNLNVPVINLHNEQVKDTDGKDLVVGSLIANILCISRPKNPQTDAIKYHALAMKINVCDGEFEFEDAEFEMVKEVLGRNEAGYSALLLAHIFKALDTKE